MNIVEEKYTPPMDPIAFIAKHGDWLVVDKPAGLLTVPGRAPEKADCLFSRVQAEDAAARVVHRLDMATSGLVIFARNELAQKRLGQYFETKQAKKRYIAIVDGLMPIGEGQIDLPIITDWPNRPLQKVDFEIGKPSLTNFRVLKQNLEKQLSWVELFPQTGRTHQLRLHLAAVGYPIVGDRLYGKREAPRLMLHAESLEMPSWEDENLAWCFHSSVPSLYHEYINCNQ